jgi:HemY protein
MARIEGGQHGHAGGVREWLARAVNAPRDPAWTADGVVADHWAAISPVTGALDAFRWRVPVEAVDAPAGARLAAKVEALVGLGGGTEPRLEHETAAASKPAAFPRPETIEPAGKPVSTVNEPSPPAPKAALPAADTAAAAPATPLAADARSAEPRRADAGMNPPTRDMREQAPAPPAISEEAAPTAETAPRRQRKTIEPKIFVPPHAPDDPGTEAAESRSDYFQGSAKA